MPALDRKHDSYGSRYDPGRGAERLIQPGNQFPWRRIVSASAAELATELGNQQSRLTVSMKTVILAALLPLLFRGKFEWR